MPATLTNSDSTGWFTKNIQLNFLMFLYQICISVSRICYNRSSGYISKNSSLLLQIQLVYFENKNLIITERTNRSSQWHLTLQSETKTVVTVSIDKMWQCPRNVHFVSNHIVTAVCLSWLNTSFSTAMFATANSARTTFDAAAVVISVFRINVCYPPNVHGFIGNT